MRQGVTANKRVIRTSEDSKQAICWVSEDGEAEFISVDDLVTFVEQYCKETVHRSYSLKYEGNTQDTESVNDFHLMDKSGNLKWSAAGPDHKESVNSPDHYNSLDASCKKCGSRIECIDVVQHMPFNTGNAVKYIWRAPHKGKREEDLRKAIKYLELELALLNADR